MLCKCLYCEQENVGLSAVTLENELSFQITNNDSEVRIVQNSEKSNQTKALVFEFIMVVRVKAYNLALVMSTENSHRYSGCLSILL